MIDRYCLFKSFGAYNAPLALLEQRLKITGEAAHRTASLLLDWALQAPTLPFLLRGRLRVGLAELMPHLRFARLVTELADTKMHPGALLNEPERAAGELFSRIGWESPAEIARRISQLNFSPGGTPFRQDMLEKLALAASVRQSCPSLLYSPELDWFGQVNRLQSGLALFEDTDALGLGTMIPGSEEWLSSCMLVLDYSITDACLIRGMGWGPTFVASCTARSTQCGSSDDLLRKRLSVRFGATKAPVFYEYFISQAADLNGKRAELQDDCIRRSKEAEEYRDRGEYSTALKLQRLLLDDVQVHLGKNHPMTIGVMNNIAVTLCRLGNSMKPKK